MTDDAGDSPGADVFAELGRRPADPDAGEWEVAAGRVAFVDLRIRSGLLAGFIDCLFDDVAETRARELLAEAARKQGMRPAT